MQIIKRKNFKIIYAKICIIEKKVLFLQQIKMFK